MVSSKKIEWWKNYNDMKQNYENARDVERRTESLYTGIIVFTASRANVR